MAQLLLRETPIGTIDGVLFDKDGTLSHSEPRLLDLAERRITAALDLWSATRGTPDPNLSSTLCRAFGLQKGALHPGGTLAVAARQDNLTSTATVFCLFGCTWPEAMSLAEDCFSSVDMLLQPPPPPSPLLSHAEPLLQNLHAHGVQLAMISNDSQSGISEFLDQHALTRLFSGCWSAEDQPRKPDPQAVLHLCDRLDLAPERCALIGDAETDLRMACAAGIGCVLGYRGGWSMPPVLPSAQHQFDSWRDLSLRAGS